MSSFMQIVLNCLRCVATVSTHVDGPQAEPTTAARISGSLIITAPWRPIFLPFWNRVPTELSIGFNQSPKKSNHTITVLAAHQATTQQIADLSGTTTRLYLILN